MRKLQVFFRFFTPVLLFLCVLSAGPLYGNVRIKLDSASLDFGGVPLISNRDLTVRATNTSDVALELDAITPTGGAKGEFTVIAPTNPPIVLPPGASVLITIRFSPKLLGLRSAGLDISTSDGDLSIPMQGKGTGEESRITMRPAILDFGKVAPDVTRDSFVTVYSLGPDSATITGIEVTNYGNDTSFSASLINSQLTFPFKLAPGDSIVILIHFNGVLPTEVKGGQIAVLGSTSTLPTCELRGTVEYGTIQLKFASIDFGAMYEGSSKDTLLPLINSGEEDVVIYDIEPLGDDFSLLNRPALPFTLAAGKQFEFKIRATPKASNGHFAQLQMITHSALPNLQSANLSLTLLSNPITGPASQTLAYSCAIPGTTDLIIPISDTGRSDFTITAISADDSTLVVTTTNALPLTIRAGQTIPVVIGVDAHSIKTGRKVAVHFYAGESLVMTDTVTFVPNTTVIDAKISAQLSPDSSYALVSVSTASDLAAYQLHDLTIKVTSADANVASIVAGSFKLTSSLSGATLKVTPDPAGGSFVANIMSATPIVPGPTGELLNFQTQRYVAAASASVLKATIEDSSLMGCLDFAADSAIIAGLRTCGSSYLRGLLQGQPLITDISLQQNPIPGERAAIRIQAPEATSCTYEVVSLIGVSLRSGTLELARGSQSFTISLAGLSCGTYSLLITAPDGSARSLRFIKE